MPTADDSIRRLIIGVLIILISGVILGATGWNFSQVAQIPEIYVKKVDLIELERTNREDHIAIEKKLDRLLEYFLQHRAFDPQLNSSIYNSNDDNEEDI